MKHANTKDVTEVANEPERKHFFTSLCFYHDFSEEIQNITQGINISINMFVVFLLFYYFIQFF